MDCSASGGQCGFRIPRGLVSIGHLASRGNTDFHRTKTICAVLVFLLLACSIVWPKHISAGEDGGAARPADTSSPRATLMNFIDSSNEFYQLIRVEKYFDRTSPAHHPHAMRILDCLDVSELAEYEREEYAGEAAVCLKEVLDRVELPLYEEVPDIDSIQAAGGLEELSRWTIPGTRITIARVENGPRKHEYLFSPGTVGRAIEYYQDVKSLPYRATGPEVSEGFYLWYDSAPGRPMVAALVDWFPDAMRERRFGVAVWKWVGLLLALPVALLLMAAAYILHNTLARRFRDKALFLYSLTILLPIVTVLIPLGFRRFAYEYLTLRGTPLYLISFFANLTALLASLVVVFGVSNRIATIIIASPRIQPQGLDAQFIRLVSKVMSLVATAILFLEGGRYLGIPITALLASAGVGGLALALAAQGTLKGLLGTMAILLDKPYRVGERIIVNEYDGVVEEIGLRSTKIRTFLNGHIVSIPNGTMAESEIENIGRRRHIRRSADIHIPLDTPREKLEIAVAAIRATLENHDGMDPEFPPRVHFFDFNPSAFVIRVIYWYSPPNYWDFLAFGEKLNFAIFRAFDEQGIQFSLPFRLTYTDIESEPQPVELVVVGGNGLSIQANREHS